MSWQAGIDARLVARLLRTRRPGLIGSGLARRIVGAVEQMAGRLSLLARFPRQTERSRAGETPIVHALPARGLAPDAAAAADPERNAAPRERAMQVVSARVVERERVIERTIVELAPPLPASPASRAPGDRAVDEPVVRTDAARPAPEPPSRRSRMGAPLAKAALPHVAPAAARATRTLVNQAAPTHAPGRIPRAPSIGTAGSGHAGASTIVAPRRAMATGPARPEAAGPAHVLPRRPKSTAEAELAAPGDPIVSPRRSPVHRAGAALAHVAVAPAVVSGAAARAAASPAPVAPHAPASPAVPSPLARAAARPIDTPLQRADLPEIAAQVQRIMERQALHDRARRGLRR